jgi:hypothetical protein
MRVVDAYSADDALAKGLTLLLNENVAVASRNGEMLESREPVTTVYRIPGRYVMFSKHRDANPFFHLYEAVWMLSGSRDLTRVATIVKNMASFSDDGQTLRGAYGHRWRAWFMRDRMEELVEEFLANPLTRRAYLPMWDGSEDGDGNPMRSGPVKDEPCNVGINFRLRWGSLNMTVFNRSNDILWGAYGANLVHFSVLQEYMAARLAAAGVGAAVKGATSLGTGQEALCGLAGQAVLPGVYRQVSDSFHLYPGVPVAHRVMGAGKDLADHRYQLQGIRHRFISQQDIEQRFDTDLRWFTEQHPVADPTAMGEAVDEAFESPWFQEVFLPMRRAWNFYRLGHYGEAMQACCESAMPTARDWSIAMGEWIQRHSARKQEKTA